MRRTEKQHYEQRIVDPDVVKKLRISAERAVRRVIGKRASRGLNRVDLELRVDDAHEEPEDY